MIDEAFKTMVKEAMREVLREERVLSPPAAAAPELLTLDQAAAHLQVGKTTVRDWLNAGKLKRYGAGRVVRVKRAELEALHSSPASTSEHAREVESKVTSLMGKLNAKRARAAKG